MNTKKVDVVVIGAGIVGLAIALAAAKRNKRVVLIERTERAVGASVRNFGLLWPVGQPAGPAHARALRSLEIWRDVCAQAGIWSEPSGSLHLAYQPDEQAVIEEYFKVSGSQAYVRQLLSAKEVCSRFSAVIPNGCAR